MGTRGFVSVGNQQVLAPDGQFDVQVPDGTYDVIARTSPLDDTGDQVAIRRNLVVVGNTMVTPDIDVAAEGTATVLVSPTVTNRMSGDELGMSDLLTTPTASNDVDSTNVVAVHVVPDAELGPHDTQSIVIEALTETEPVFSERAIRRRYTADTSVVFDLPPALTVQYSTAGGQSIVTWTTLPPFDGLGFEIFQQDVNSAGLSTAHDVQLSASYVAATGVTSAAFDTDLPGVDPAWRAELSVPWSQESQATRTDGGDVITLFYGEDVFPSPSAVIKHNDWRRRFDRR
jgi:hypothetical protein